MVVRIDEAIFDSYYNGCCNGTFWPLFHSMPDRATFKIEHWKAYNVANKEFAKCSMTALRTLVKTDHSTGANVPLLWIHDYQLMLAANWIRQVIKMSKDRGWSLITRTTHEQFE